MRVLKKDLYYYDDDNNDDVDFQDFIYLILSNRYYIKIENLF